MASVALNRGSKLYLQTNKLLLEMARRRFGKKLHRKVNKTWTSTRNTQKTNNRKIINAYCDTVQLRLNLVSSSREKLSILCKKTQTFHILCKQ